MRPLSIPLFLALLSGPALPAGALPTPGEIPSPEAFFGHPMGADRRLESYDRLLPYFERLAAESDRIDLRRIGKTVEGRDLVLLLVSAPRNLARADHYRELSARINDPRGISPPERQRLVDEAKVVLLVTYNIHSDEIVSSQLAAEWLYRMATGDAADPHDPVRFLDDVIVLFVPSLNPDGQVKVTEWYERFLGTPYEGGRMPWLYHTYAGHDNNRDWFMLNLPETRAVNRVAYHEWFPQVLVDVHQMGATGPRAFVPPYSDPVAEHVHPLIHRGSLLLGANMAMDLERAGKSGVIYGYSFDAYWPGGTRTTPWWKNTVGILVEIASCRVASPLLVDPGELVGGRKGLADYRAQVNFPNPWPGGWWRPLDILEYERLITDSALRTCSLYRADLLENRMRMADDARTAAARDRIGAFVIPAAQADRGTAAKLADLLRENGLDVYRADADLSAGASRVAAGSWVIPADQPYYAFLREMLEPATYPEVRVDPMSAEIYRPYDVTAWSLPYLMGVDVVAVPEAPRGPLTRIEGPAWTEPGLVEGPGTAWALTPRENDAYAAVFRLLARGAALRQATAAFQAGGREWPPGTFLADPDPGLMESALAGLAAQAFRVPVPPGLRVRRLAAPRVALYQSWLAPMDEGWTRFLFDGFGVPYRTVHDADLREGRALEGIDVLVLPDQNRTEIVDGASSDTSEGFPPAYCGGWGEEGLRAVKRFVAGGGTLVTLGNAGRLAVEDLSLPVGDVTDGLTEDEFSTPGTILRVRVDTAHPLGYGMPDEALVYHTSCPVLTTHASGPGHVRSVVARFVEEDRVVASGWAEGTRYLARRAALVEAASGKGKVVIAAFRPQYRGQTHGTYRVLLNALLDAAATEAEPAE